MSDNYFENFRINRIIAHEIFKRDDNREIVPPEYSEELTFLEGRGLIALQDRIIGALGRGSHSLKMTIEDDAADSAFQKAVGSIRAEDPIFVQNSKDLAYRLAQAQTSRGYPGGVVVIMDGTTGAQNYHYTLIMKAEILSGFSKSSDGQRILLEYLSDLLLTPQQKFYKIGIFIEDDNSNGEVRASDDFTCYVYDHNIKTKDEEQRAAQYFYESFLGCSFSLTDKKLTKDFYQYTRTYINKSDIDDETKIDLQNSLYVYLKLDQSSVVKVSDFANQYLGENLREDYIIHMRNKQFTENAISKDLTYLSKSLRKRKIKFTSDVQLIVPSENFNDLVKVTGSNTTTTFLEITGSIKDQD